MPWTSHLRANLQAVRRHGPFFNQTGQPSLQGFQSLETKTLKNVRSGCTYPGVPAARRHVEAGQLVVPPAIAAVARQALDDREHDLRRQLQTWAQAPSQPDLPPMCLWMRSRRSGHWLGASRPPPAVVNSRCQLRVCPNDDVQQRGMISSPLASMLAARAAAARSAHSADACCTRCQ